MTDDTTSPNDGDGSDSDATGDDYGPVDMARDAGAASESDTERDGAFSYKSESHSFGNGVYVGLTTHPLQTPPVPEEGTTAREDYDAERHYWRAGYIVGTLLQLVAIAAFVLAFGPEAVAAVGVA